MLYYDRIDASEGIYINKLSTSENCDICHYWHFLDKGFKFRGVDYRCIINGISKSDVVNILQNPDLID